MQGSTVVATIDAGARFVVHLTPGGADALGLRPGDARLADHQDLLVPRRGPVIRCEAIRSGTMALLTVRAAAQRLGVGYSTLKQWIYSGSVRTTTTAGGHHRVAEAEIDRLVAQRRRRQRRRRGEGRPRRTGLIVALSGRNRLRGFIEEVRIDGLLAQVRLAIGDQRLTAVITADAVDELKLKRGDHALAIIKSTEVMIGARSRAARSAAAQAQARRTRRR